MNLNLQHNNIVIVNDESKITKEILALLNYKISLDLKDFELISLYDNYILIHKETMRWAFHIRTSQHKGFWNYDVLQSPFSVFSINGEEYRENIIMDWIKNFMTEELDLKIEKKIKLSECYSNRLHFIKQMLNVSKTECIINSDSKYLKKYYWLERSI